MRWPASPVLIFGPSEVRSRSRLGRLKEAPMFSGERQVPEWMRLGPATSSAEGTLEGPSGGLGVAWHVWERLRGWDRRYAFVVDSVLALGLFLVGSGWFVLSEHPHPNVGLVAALTLPLILRRRAP